MTYKLYRITTEKLVFYYGALRPPHALMRFLADHEFGEWDEKLTLTLVSDADKAAERKMRTRKGQPSRTVWDEFAEQAAKYEANGDASKESFSISTAFRVAAPKDLR